MTVKKINGEDVVWGSEGFTTVGTCLTGSVKRTGQKENIPNETGGTRGKVYYEVDITITAEVLFPANGTVPNIGDAITAGGETCYVDDVEEKAANKDFKKISFTASTSQTMKVAGGTSQQSQQASAPKEE